MYNHPHYTTLKKHLWQGLFLDQSHLKKFRIILLFTIAYTNSRLVQTSLFSTISTTPNVIRGTTLNVRGSNTSIAWKQEKVCS